MAALDLGASTDHLAGPPSRRQWKRVFKNKLAYFGAVGLLILLVTSLAGPALVPKDPVSQSLLYRLEGPSAEHWLGTDEYGRDVLARIVYATRVSVGIALMTILLSLAAGTALGIIAGYKGGKVDAVITEFANVFLAFPTVVMGILVLVAIGPGVTNVIISLSIAFTPRFIRLARASTVAIKELTFTEAARAAGASDWRIMVKHVLPNAISSSIVSGALWTATVIRAESALSFLGLGVQPPHPSWGNMISDGLVYILEAPWLILYPAIAIMFAVLTFNMLGDALRDYLDPRAGIV